jgi:4-amino-4-deoxy-L-arabinose transferase-like glycosyltransferase
MFIKSNRVLTIFVALSCVASFLISYKYLHYKYQVTESNQYIGEGERGLNEMLDYHFMAVNFALANKFPVIGYLMDSALYRINPNSELDFYFGTYKQSGAGAVVFFHRWPLYPLFVGFIYKVFGYNFFYNQWVNILMISLIVGSMPWLGFRGWGAIGYCSGILGGWFFFLFNTYNVGTLDIDVFVSFVFFIAFVFALYAEKKDTPLHFFIAGIAIGIGLLAKGAILFLPVIYLLYFLSGYRNVPILNLIKKAAALFLGITFLVLPWLIYIKYQEAITVKERQAWSAKVTKSIPRIELNNLAQFDSILFAQEVNAKGESVTNVLMASMCKQYYVSSVTLSKNFAEPVLDYNNEYCTIDRPFPFHAEWRYIKNSFYKTHFQQQSTLVKIFGFYCYHPKLIVQIPMARLRHVAKINDYPLFFWLGGALWGLSMLQQRLCGVQRKICRYSLAGLLFFMVVLVCAITLIFFTDYAAVFCSLLFLSGFVFLKKGNEPKVSVAFPFFWLNFFLIIVVLMGDGRLVKMFLPVSCFYVVYLTLHIGRKFIKHVLGSRQLKWFSGSNGVPLSP